MNQKITLKQKLHRLLLLLLLCMPGASFAQTYCIPSFTNVANYGVGMQNVTIGSINNSTTTSSTAPYNDYTSMVTTHKAGDSVKISVRLGTGNSTQFKIYVDWNNDGTFANAEEMFTNGSTNTTSNSVITGAFVVPNNQAAGVYRIRVAGDIGFQTPSACAIAYTGEVEDYTMIVLQSATGTDAMAVRVDPAFFSVGNNNVSLTWYNLGTTTITSAQMGYKLNNGTPVTQNFSGSVATGAGNTLNFSTPLNITAGTHVLKVWVTNPNSVNPDLSPANDTITLSFCTALSGTYTINKTGSGANNFTSFSDAVAKLNSCGINGPVVLNVAAGTYTEQIELDDVNGVSATNTITFDGGAGNAATRILEYAATSSTDAYTFRVKNTQYVRIMNLTILARGSSYGNPLHLMGTSSNAIVKNNVITYIGNGLTSTSTNAYRGIKVDNSTLVTNGSDCGGTATTHANLLIDSNTIIGGSTGISFFANSSCINTRMTNNRIIDVYDVAIQMSSVPGYYIHDNYMNMRPTGSTSSRGIGHCNGSNGGSGAIPYDIQRNIILNAGNRGMYLQTINNSSNQRSKIINNLIGGGFRSTSGYGIQMQYERNFEIINNSILVDNNVSSSFIGIAMGANYTGNTIINNNIAFTHPSAQGLAYNAPGPATLAASEYNNFYKANPNSPDLVMINGTSYNASNIKGGQGYNNVFYNQAPGFISNLDLHYDSTIAPMYGDASVGLQIDVDGDPRCPDAPTIGGDESKYPFPKPVAGFTHPDTIYVNNAADFLNNLSNTSPYRHRWYVNGTQVATTHDLVRMFTATGTYNVSVVSYACGSKDSFNKAITVISPVRAPKVDFSVDRNVISVGETVSLKDLSMNGPSAWEWEITPKMAYDASLGMMVPAYSYISGTDSSSQNPVLRFDYAGSFTVCLKASNSFGSASICKTRYVRVKENITICNTSEVMSNKNYGIITDDGGNNTNYTSGKNCGFLISPCSPNLGVKIKSFTLAANDYLRLYDGNDNTAPKLYDTKAFPNGLTGTATTIPGFPDTIMSKSGKIFVEFVTDGSGVAAGFELEWFADSFNLTPPVADFSAPDTVCYGLDVLFTNRSQGFGNMYFWDFNDDGFIDSDKENPTDLFINAGPQVVKLIVENCGGIDSISKTIFVINPTVAPLPDFTADMTAPNAGTDVVKFTDKSFRCVDEWKWEFTPNTVSFVNGTSASSQHPEVKFNSGGCYTVKLRVGYNGAQDSISRSCYINAVSYCTPTVSILTSDIGISSVTINNMSNNSAVADQAYTDYTTTKSVDVMKQVPVSISVRRQTNFNPMSVAVWVDLNQDGDFEDAGERVAFNANVTGTTFNSSFTIPQSIKLGGTRLRVGTNLGNLPNIPCGTNRNGEYEDYRLNIIEDNVAPVITLIGNDTVRIETGTPYVDSGATAMDNINGNITANIVVTNNVNTLLMGTYTVRYNVADSAGNKANEVTRVVIVEADTTAPVITLTNGDTVYVEVGSPYTEPGFTATDPGSNADLTADVTVSGSVDTAVVGTYFISYRVEDPSGNITVKQRTVIVRDTVKPVVTLNGADTVYVEIYTSYIDSGVTITDNYWKNLTAVVTSNVDTAKLGIYTVVYTVTDSSGNMTTLTRTVIVRDTQIPVITLNGPDTLTVEVFSQYFELGATVSDNFSQNINVQISGTVNTSVLGFYTITYTAVDANGNVADSVTRTVHVVDTKAPVITLIGLREVTLRRGETYTDSGYTVSDNYWPVASLTIDTLTDFKGDGTDVEGGYFIRYTATDSSGNVSFVERLISVGVNGIGEATALNGTVSIFPNPAANGMFNVDVKLAQSENVKVSIFNMLGQEIRVLHNGNLSNQRFNVQLNENAGMYFVRIQGANATVTKPVVITK